MTALAPAPVLPRTREHPIGWRAMAKATFVQRRGMAIGLCSLFVLGAAAIVLQRFTHPASVSGGNIDTDAFSALVIALSVLPVVIGVFVGAPLVSRELESGTFRFAWTQGAGRTRVVLTSLALVAAFTVPGTCVLGLLIAWYAHRFEVLGVASQWQSGQFEVTALTLAAWSVFALTLGTFLGAVIARTVAAMAATAVVLGGLVVASFADFTHELLSVAPLATAGISPFGLGLGALNMYGTNGEGPAGSWLVRSWFTGPGGHVLGTKAASTLYYEMESIKGAGDPTPWLALHHDAYWVSYQPASRFWIFQGIEGITLLCLAALLAASTLWWVKHRV